MEAVEDLAKEPDAKQLGLFQAVAVVVLRECESYGDPIRQCDLH
jgi:hypothetical protein